MPSPTPALAAPLLLALLLAGGAATAAAADGDGEAAGPGLRPPPPEDCRAPDAPRSEALPPPSPPSRPLRPAAAAAAAAAAALPHWQPSTRLEPAPRDPARRGALVLRARTLEAGLDGSARAEGEVELRQGGLVVRAEQLRYDGATGVARAEGQVRIARGGTVYSGRELELALERFEGFFLEPQFELMPLGARGSASRIDFLGEGRSRLADARYSGCEAPPDGGEPDWLLVAREVRLDVPANEGVAEGARLRFLGVPILALPSLSFPLDDRRKSGWLPPSINIDNRSGVVVSVPWYWNIAPNRDATIAPRLITRRGVGLDTEFRYLEPAAGETPHEGALRLDVLPADQVARRTRAALQWQHGGSLAPGLRVDADIVRVSDADWWKDFPDGARSFTPRLLGARLALEQALAAPGGGLTLYARALQWQVLQDEDSFVVAPYERSPQVGARWAGRAAGFEWSLASEFNRFTLPGGQAESLGRPTGDRWHAVGSLSHPWRGAGWFVVPRLAFNAAAYDGTERGPGGFVRGRRLIPTLSLDAGFELERRTEAFGRELEQTLEPRVLLVKTPYREQAGLPNYDSAAKDFNIVSLFTDNSFSGIDRVSDAQQLTAGFTTRLVDVASGAETLRLGVVQRVLFAPQQVAPAADGSPDGPTLNQRLSDALLVGSTSVLPGWTFDAALQYSPDLQRSVRSIVGARYSPGPFRTVGATYRLARGLSEQLEVGWQWPLSGRTPADTAAGAAGGRCGGAWYSVGRFNYSLKDRRLTDSILGLEYDAGCWIVRVVAEQLSTGRREATTRILLQLELVGLSRLGSNPLGVLRENIPGYRLLRDDRGSAPSVDPGPTP